MALQRPRRMVPAAVTAAQALAVLLLPALPRQASTRHNPTIGSARCALGGQLPQTDLARIQSAFKTGTIDGACDDIGGVHESAAGYATIDVVGNCSANTPRDRGIGETPHPPFGHLLPSRRGEGSRTTETTTMKTLLGSLLALTLAWTASAVTPGNDDSCDIAVLPAATLLLPYFEVDLDDPGSTTTLFTITNAANEDAIARVTLWTDRGYPVFTFNVQLTGYDVQALNLYDILGAGVIAPGTEARGVFSDPDPALVSCDAPPGGALDPAVVARLQSAFTTGAIPGECDDAGGVHENATGYATIDVVGNCSANTPRDRAYWRTDLRHDNILLGDYQQIEDGRAQGGPLVHVRVVPEQGRTFYARYTDRDWRQPLPSQFAARWTSGTSLKIWREGRAGMNATCDDYAADENLAVAEVVAFDDQENAAEGGRIELAASTKTAVDDPLLPQIDGTNGWLYLNLDRSRRDDFASQGWVIASNRDGDRDAIALANGCAAPAETGAKIAPAGEDDSCDVALLPAATLLLPYFEVDTGDPRGETTIFTITNVSPRDQIARVTLWTDYAFPVITFNVYLTGYDVQSINLYDVIARGLIAPDTGTGREVSERGPRSGRNFALDLSACAQLPGRLPADFIQRMQLAFREGRVPALGSLEGCNNVGGEHDHAIGYATVDVVRNCEETSPLEAEYWSEDLAYDNVLIGDFQQASAEEDVLQSSTLVHVRAMPDTDLPRTFYGRFTDGDARQPLPSVFAARWIEGGPAQYETYLKIWREGAPGGACATWDDSIRVWTETVTFDEAENPVADLPDRPAFPIPEFSSLPATARINVNDASVLPQPVNDARGGWIYINLDDPLTEGDATQAWVVSWMRAAGRYAVDVDAAALGNGCSAEAPPSEVTIGTEPIGPRP